MQYQLKRIQDGSFAKEFIDDQDAGAPHFKELQEKYSNERIETVGPKLRAMFSWNKDGVKDADEANSYDLVNNNAVLMPADIAAHFGEVLA